jgi:hypothetical protein
MIPSRIAENNVTDTMEGWRLLKEEGGRGIVAKSAILLSAVGTFRILGTVQM